MRFKKLDLFYKYETRKNKFLRNKFLIVIIVVKEKLTEEFKTAFERSLTNTSFGNTWCRNNYIFPALEALSTVPW